MEYNQTVNLTRKIFKSKSKCMLPLLPIMYRKPVQLKLPAMVPIEPVVSMEFIESRRPVPVESSMSKRPGSSKKPVTIPIESGRVKKSRAVSREALVKSKTPVKLQRKPLQCKMALYIPPAEEKENYETLLSILEAAAVKTDRGDIGQTSDQYKSSSKPVAIQASQGDISPSSDHGNSTSKPVAIPAGRGDISHLSDQCRYLSQAVDEL